jgi:SAM-dependent methyltransferase
MLPLVTPKTGLPLRREGDDLVADSGERFPVVNGIPRFVSSDNYAAAFGLEWTIHSQTQLDSKSGTNISRERLERCLGAPVSAFRDQNVLEAGCGAGRFSELLVEGGAHLHAIDLSVAVEANRGNIGDRPNYVVAQADLRYPPFPRESFDIVLCLGVLQHTPSPEESIRALWQMVKPGGMLVIDHYTWSFSLVTKLAPLYRPIFLRMEPAKAKRAIDRIVDFFFPLHWAFRRFRPAQMLLSRISPVASYCHHWPQLTREQHKEWSRLDTFDHLTDRYKHLRSKGQIRKILTDLGAADPWVQYGGNGVEARARKPA